MYAQLGDIKFELITYFNKFELTKSFNYAQHDVIEGKPKLQFVGDGLDAVAIGLNFHRKFCQPRDEWQRLNDTARTHEALDFIFGNGEYKGKFVVEELVLVYEQTDSQGEVDSLQAELKLKEWAEDQIIGTRRETPKAVKNGAVVKKDKTSKTYSAVRETNKDGVSMTKIKTK